MEIHIKHSSNKTKFASAILNRIIKKGGLYGHAAKIYAGDDKKTDQFIIECSEQCHFQNVKRLWGEKLLKDINLYVALTRAIKKHKHNLHRVRIIGKYSKNGYFYNTGLSTD